MRSLRVALAQINTTVGDISGNVKIINEYISMAKELKVDLIAFPELCITGYPPEDLLLNPAFIDENLRALDDVARSSKDIAVIIGFVNKDDDIFNAAALINNGEIVARYHKIYLPNYSVFDEYRYFQAGRDILLFSLHGVTIGLSICEDIWYPGDPTRAQALLGNAELIINISSSPFHAGKSRFREMMLCTRASDNRVKIAYVNLVGGQDELVFDGCSFIINEKGQTIAIGKQFEEDLIIADINADDVFRERLHDPRRRAEKISLSLSEEEFYQRRIKKIILKASPKYEPKPSLPVRSVRRIEGVEEIYRALTLGVRDYVRKNSFEKVLIGISGGIDSALTAAIAVDALGRDSVIGVTMPSRYSSSETRRDAERLAKNLGIRLIEIPIEPVFQEYMKLLEPTFSGMKMDVTEENLQARIRGNLLMALSNKFGWLVLSTGNKSETSTGYCTLYGDMVGGFSVLKDVLKTTVYKLAEYRNSLEGREVIPVSIIERVPSAELRENQKDSDTLPPYEILDGILKAYVEEDRPFQEIVDMGFDPLVVKKVIEMVDRNEYKRRQAPPGIKITPRAFGKDRRFPITNRYRCQG